MELKHGRSSSSKFARRIFVLTWHGYYRMIESPGQCASSFRTSRVHTRQYPLESIAIQLIHRLDDGSRLRFSRSCKNLERSLFSRGRISTSFPYRSCKNLEGPSFLQGDGYFSISFASILQEFREDSIFQGDGSRLRFSIDLARI